MEGNMDMYEQSVQTFLTVFDHLAVLPQFPVLFDEEDRPCFRESPGRVGWAAFPDFLAIDAKNGGAQIIEVSKSLYPNQINDLARRTLANRAKVEEYAKWFTSGRLQLEWRFFVRREMVDKLRSKLEAGGLQAKFNTLEDVFDRVRKEMP
jgi:hypothetical protein